MFIINMIIMKYKNLSFKNKLLFSYLFIILLPIILLSTYTLNKSINIIETQAVSMASESLEQATINFNNKLDVAARVYAVLLSNEKVRSILEKDPSATAITEQINDYKYLENLILSLQAGGNAHSMRLYVKDGFLYSNQRITTYNLNDLLGTDIYNSICSSLSSMYFGSSTEYTYILGNKTRIIPLGVPIRSFQDFNQIIGIIIIDFLESDIINLLRSADFTSKGTVYLLDKNNRIVCSSDSNYITFNEKLNEVNPELLIPTSKDQWIKSEVNGKTFIMGYNNLSNGYKIYSFIPLEELLLDASQLKHQIIIFAFILGLIVYLLAYWTTRHNSRRIKNLALNMELAENGNLDILSVVDSEDEIGSLQHSFNYMIKNTKIMMQEKYEMGQNLKNLELNALQAQINPHFLYNTLDLIYWSCKEAQAETACTIVENLAKFYRISLSKGRTFIPIKTEIQHVLHYINIQNYRFKDTISLTVSIPPEIEDYPIMKLVLQPIIENAIFHGIMEKESKSGKITISAHYEFDEIIIIIHDDGIGMTQEQLSKLFLPDDKKAGGYGIYNINERLKLFYGADYGLSFDSQPGEGTNVIIKIPKI
jgi:two-component system, sensor histidine kinase YesM